MLGVPRVRGKWLVIALLAALSIASLILVLARLFRLLPGIF